MVPFTPALMDDVKVKDSPKGVLFINPRLSLENLISIGANIINYMRPEKLKMICEGRNVLVNMFY